MAPKRQDTCRVCGGPRDPAINQGLCAQHFSEYNAAHHAKSRQKGAASYTPEYRRIDKYRAEATRQGATEDESWWIAMAAEARYQQQGRSSRWLGPFVAAELAWLRENARVLAKLDRERGVA